MRKLSREVRLFSAYPNHVNVRRHLAAGGTAYFPRRGWIVEGAGAAEQSLVEIATIPAVLGGAAQHQLMNALAAVAACRAQGRPTSLPVRSAHSMPTRTTRDAAPCTGWGRDTS